MIVHRCLSALLSLFLTLAVLAPSAFAGPFDKLKKKAEKTATEKADETVNKSTEEPAGTKEESPAGAKEDEASAKGAEGATSPAGGSMSSVSTKFDFVPGDKVIFADDFTQDELGEFPARWKLETGTFEVVEAAGERWLRCISNDGLVQMKTPGLTALPEFWTLEFDGSNLDQAGNSLTVSGLTASGETVWETVFPYSGQNVFIRAGKITADTPYGGSVAGRHHFMFMARGTGLKVYMDRERMASVPDVTENGVATQITYRLWSPEKPMIANVRFAEGCRPAKDMLAEGKLVTYGIHFETGSDVVQPDSAPILRQVAAYLGSKPEVKLKITGHTDNVGKPAANLDLSKRRAAAVASVLSAQFGIGADRLTTDGKGDTDPLSSNDKVEGRAMNRRVEFAKN
jgi:outer membrane protein OmpA-like peptidoglycan-associated protein